VPEIGILTPVAGGNEKRLRDLLRQVSKSRSDGSRAAGGGAGQRSPSPFAEMPPRTHFARLVVIDIRKPHLFFTSRFDGAEEDYLAALAAAPKTAAIWGHCKRPARVDARALTDYFLRGRDRVDASYVLSVWGGEFSVAQVNRALELRAAVAGLAARSGELDAAALSHAFRQLEPVARLAEP
jgi:hypothetical protein